MTTLVLGASPNPARYSNLAIKLLRSYQHEVIAVGKKNGEVENVPILHEFPSNKKVDTLTLYMNPENQKEYYESILALHPRRIIFNPGTENPELEALVKEKGILTEEACTLVLLNTGQY